MTDFSDTRRLCRNHLLRCFPKRPSFGSTSVLRVFFCFLPLSCLVVHVVAAAFGGILVLLLVAVPLSLGTQAFPPHGRHAARPPSTIGCQEGRRPGILHHRCHPEDPMRSVLHHCPVSRFRMSCFAHSSLLRKTNWFRETAPWCRTGFLAPSYWWGPPCVSAHWRCWACATTYPPRAVPV